MNDQEIQSVIDTMKLSGKVSYSYLQNKLKISWVEAKKLCIKYNLENAQDKQ